MTKITDFFCWAGQKALTSCITLWLDELMSTEVKNLFFGKKWDVSWALN